MNREIKFRAWIETGYDDNDEVIYEMCYDLAFEDYEPINDLLNGVKNLMQYTGLKDKNGKEIYEGDIVNYLGGGLREDRNSYKVIYREGQFFCISGNWEIQFQNWTSTTFFEVIGNIYENPELLAKGDCGL